MLRFLEALNPWNSCFTVTDFEDALVDINSILKKIDLASKDTSHSPSHAQTKQMLETAFSLTASCLNATRKQKPDTELTFLLAEILRHYASLCYHENYFSAKQLLLVSFNLHLYSIGIFNECIDIRDYMSLENLRHQSEIKPNLFTTMEESVLTTSMDRCMTLAYTSSFAQYSPKNKLYCIAETARWLGHCYQHLDQTTQLSTENELRFSNLFVLSESLHLLADNEESKACLADLYYQAWPFMYKRKNPEDFKGACQLYEKALYYDPSKEMQAKVANQRFLILFDHKQKSEALSQISKAILAAETLEDSDEHRLLLASLYDNYASYLMDPDALNLEHAEINLARTSKYAAQSRANGKDYLQFAFYDLRFAEFKFVSGEFKAAKELVERALTTIRKHPHSQAPHLVKAEAFRSLIDKTLVYQIKA